MRKTALLALVGSAAAFAPAGVPSLRSTNAVRWQAVTELRVCVAHLDSPTLKIATRRLPSRIQKMASFHEQVQLSSGLAQLKGWRVPHSDLGFSRTATSRQASGGLTVQPSALSRRRACK